MSNNKSKKKDKNLDFTWSSDMPKPEQKVPKPSVTEPIQTPPMTSEFSPLGPKSDHEGDEVKTPDIVDEVPKSKSGGTPSKPKTKVE